MVQSVFDTIRNFKKEDGTLLCDSFIRAPKRRQEPTYYDVNKFFFLEPTVRCTVSDVIFKYMELIFTPQ